VRRVLLSPRWLLGHVLALAAAAICLRLGWWQWQRAHSGTGSLQNLGYAVQWPIFACFILALWWRVLHDELRPPQAAERPRVGRAHRTGPAPADPLPPLAADNRYLGWLHEHDQMREQGQRGPR
jgi:hypothetical protein